MSALIVAVWLRNRDILRDMFDYSIIIGAVGKLEAGFRPYSGIRSPMQSSVYLLNYASEWVFGGKYLGLTVGGLVQAWGGALLIRWMLLKRLQPWPATWVAMGIAFAGLLQHMVFFYNPIGILCLAVIVLGVAMEPDLWPVKDARTVAIYGALWLGGMNKLNFQGAALVLAGLLCVAAWRAGTTGFRGCLKTIGVLVGMGILVPVATELMWTGATLPNWINDVVLLPQARLELIDHLLGAKLFLRPAYDYHHHLLLPQIGGVGAAVLIAVGLWLGWEAWGARRDWSVWLIRGAVVIVGLVLDSLLMLTNHEAVVLTSLAFPILALALYLQTAASRGGHRLIEWAVLGAWGVWVIVGGYAAWHGSRLLYAQNPPPRSDYVRFHTDSPMLAYFDGVRLLPTEAEAIRRVAARLELMKDAGGKLPGVLFGPALEWMERAHPEAVVRGAPVWYDAGTTLREGDGPYFKQLLGNGVRRLVTHKGWQAWPRAISRLLQEGYRAEMLGSRDVIYSPRGPLAPPVRDDPPERVTPVTVFRTETGSNLLLSATRTSLGMELHAEPGGSIFGAAQDTAWSWPSGARSFTGGAVARLAPECGVRARVSFRVMAGDPDAGVLLWETTVVVTPEERVVRVPLAVQSVGRAGLWLVTTVDAALSPGSVVAGWKEIRILHAGEGDDASVPPAFGAGLALASGLAPDSMQESIWYVAGKQAIAPEGANAIPVQNWRKLRGTEESARVHVLLQAKQSSSEGPVVVTLAWYRAGRFEIMAERQVDVAPGQSLTLKGHVPEPTGWVGVLVRPAGAEPVSHRMSVQSWEIWPM